MYYSLRCYKEETQLVGLFFTKGVVEELCKNLSLVNHKNEKDKKWKFVNENYITVPKVLFFKTTDLYTVYPFSEYPEK